MTYAEYINSPEWAEKRKAVRLRDKKCQKCGRKRFLHVHHLTYENFGNEKLEDLILLCNRCHDLEHRGFGVASEKQIRQATAITREQYGEEVRCF